MTRLDPRSWTRETRLLVMTLALSVTVLLALARFRFPQQERLELPIQPLQRLAARASSDDLSAAVARASDRVRPDVLVVPIGSGDEVRSYSIDEVLFEAPSQQPVPSALALCYEPRLALIVSAAAPVADGLRVTAVRARDDLRGLAVAETTSAACPRSPELSDTTAPQYLLVAEATAAGVVMRPLFGATSGTIANSHWDRPLRPLGAEVAVSNGALVFTLDGALVGAVIVERGVRAILPADALLRAARRLAGAAPGPPATIGVHLQPLDAAIAAVTGAHTGVTVSGVDPGSTAASLLAPGDVIVEVAGRAVTTPEEALVAIARLKPGEAAELTVRRAGAERVVRVATTALAASGGAERDRGPGLSLERTAAGIVVVGVAPGSPADRAGLRRGDRLVSIDGTPVAAPARLAATFKALAPGHGLLLALERGDNPLVLALVQPD